jgi:predicted aldo/keto reductase-like oxidoreductase
LKAAQQKNVGVIGIKGAHDRFLPPSLRDQIKNEFARDSKLNFHQFAYRFVLDQPQVTSVAIRMANMLQVDEALVLSQKKLQG